MYCESLGDGLCEKCWDTGVLPSKARKWKEEQERSSLAGKTIYQIQVPLEFRDLIPHTLAFRICKKDNRLEKNLQRVSRAEELYQELLDKGIPAVMEIRNG